MAAIPNVGASLGQLPHRGSAKEREHDRTGKRPNLIVETSNPADRKRPAVSLTYVLCYMTRLNFFLEPPVACLLLLL